MQDHDPEKPPKQSPGVSRREFLKISGISAVAANVIGIGTAEATEHAVEMHGPGKTPVVLTVNGKQYPLELEPRVTLLDALRDHLDITGAKRVCDRGECGACTVLMDGKSIYACSVLAIEAQGRQITTVEALTQGGKLHPMQQAFVDHDATQCGFCTPGFLVACKALVDEHPDPTPDQLRRGLSGNFCRCGTYSGIREAIAHTVRKGA